MGNGMISDSSADLLLVIQPSSRTSAANDLTVHALATRQNYMILHFGKVTSALEIGFLKHRNAHCRFIVDQLAQSLRDHVHRGCDSLDDFIETTPIHFPTFTFITLCVWGSRVQTSF